MITKQIQNALNEQINAELWSAYLYLSMSLDAETKGMGGVSNWMFVQWKEEQDHARILQLFLIRMAAPVILMPIASVRTTWGSIAEMFDDALRHEKKVTQMINELMDLAIKEKNFATMNRLMWFIDEQTEEEASVQNIINSIEQIGTNGAGLRLLDEKLSKRKYEPADALCTH